MRRIPQKKTNTQPQLYSSSRINLLLGKNKSLDKQLSQMEQKIEKEKKEKELKLQLKKEIAEKEIKLKELEKQLETKKKKQPIAEKLNESSRCFDYYCDQPVDDQSVCGNSVYSCSSYLCDDSSASAREMTLAEFEEKKKKEKEAEREARREEAEREATRKVEEDKIKTEYLEGLNAAYYQHWENGFDLDEDTVAEIHRLYKNMKHNSTDFTMPESRFR